MQMADRKVRGKDSGTVPSVGEILPETIETIVAEFAGPPLFTARYRPPPGQTPDALCGMSAPGQLFRHQESCAQGHLYQ